MRQLLFITGIFFMVSLGWCQQAWSEKAYVSDVFQITLRTGPSLENKIIDMISSGQPLEVLQSEGDWSYVRLLGDGEGKVGWVLNRYLMTRLPWEVQAASLAEKNESLDERLKPLEREFKLTRQREEEIREALEKKTREEAALRRAYESLKEEASGYLRLKRKHQVLQVKLENALEQTRELSLENNRLKSSQRDRWFATGALVLLCGLMIGLVIGKQQRKRRSTYY